MRCPTLSELLPPPPGKTGWPWTEESPQLPDTMPDGRPWPRVSIVTPSYNQAQFIEETIRSVLLQGYPNLEYIIIDGGSTDGSVDIIRKYEPWLAHWVSEPDRGQSHAINEGFGCTTGDIFAWLNSDDTYEPGAIGAAANYLEQKPITGVVYGQAYVIDEAGRIKSRWEPLTFSLKEMVFLQESYVPQVSTFFRRDVFERVGGVNEDMYWTMDYDLWLRMGKCTQIDQIADVLGNYREHSTAKTVTANTEGYLSRHELLQCFHSFFADPELSPRLRALEPYAYGLFYLISGLIHFQLGQTDDGRTHIEEAFTLAPTLAEECRKWVLRPLVAYASGPHGLEQSLAYLETVSAHLPPVADPLHILIERAKDRLLIIHATRTQDATQIAQARRSVGSVLRHDPGWLIDRQVLTSIASLFIGQRVLQTLAEMKRKLFFASVGPAVSRKSYPKC